MSGKKEIKVRESPVTPGLILIEADGQVVGHYKPGRTKKGELNLDAAYANRTSEVGKLVGEFLAKQLRRYYNRREGDT